MTTKQIESAQAKVNTKYELAKKIRELLDAARKEYGPQAWDDAGLDGEIMELVTEDA